MNRHTHTPVNCVWFSCFVSLLLGLLAFAGPLAIGAIFTLVVTGQYVAYSIPIACRFFGGAEWVPGPFSLGRLVSFLSLPLPRRFSGGLRVRFFVGIPGGTRRAPLDGVLGRHPRLPDDARADGHRHELHRRRPWRLAPPLRRVLLLPAVRRRALVHGPRCERR